MSAPTTKTTTTSPAAPGGDDGARGDGGGAAGLDLAAIYVAPRSGAVLLLIIALVVGAGAAVAQVWTNLRSIELGYSISKETRKRRKLLETHRRLRIEVALLKTPARIAKLARAMGMSEPEPDQVRRLAAIPGDHNGRHDDASSTMPRAPAIAVGAEPTLAMPSSAWPVASDD